MTYMAPAASITDVCPDRAAHGALVVRLFHMAPAANACESANASAAGRAIHTASRRRATRLRVGLRPTRANDRWHKTQTHTRQPARRGASY